MTEKFLFLIFKNIAVTSSGGNIVYNNLFKIILKDEASTFTHLNWIFLFILKSELKKTESNFSLKYCIKSILQYREYYFAIYCLGFNVNI